MSTFDEIDKPEPTLSDRMGEPKLWRIYYNCRADFPFLVAVDNGTIATQVRVQWYECEPRTRGNTDMGPKNYQRGIFYSQPEHSLREQRKGKHNEPTWWIETFAIAEFANGGVQFHDPGKGGR